MPKYRRKPQTVDAEFFGGRWTVRINGKVVEMLSDGEFRKRYERIPDDPYTSPFTHMEYLDDPIQRRGFDKPGGGVLQ